MTSSIITEEEYRDIQKVKLPQLSTAIVNLLPEISDHRFVQFHNRNY